KIVASVREGYGVTPDRLAEMRPYLVQFVKDVRDGVVQLGDAAEAGAPRPAGEANADTDEHAALILDRIVSRVAADAQPASDPEPARTESESPLSADASLQEAKPEAEPKAEAADAPVVARAPGGEGDIPSKTEPAPPEVAAPQATVPTIGEVTG